MSLRPLFSHDTFTAQRYGGISRSMLELMRELGVLGVDWHAWAGRHRNGFLRSATEEPWTRGRVTAEERPTEAGRLVGGLWNEPGFRRFIDHARPDLVHRTYHPFLDLVPRGLPVVETLHDMWDERWPGPHKANRYPRMWVKKRALERADAIVCVSQSTRNELNEVWPQFDGKCHVIPHGVRRLAGSPRNPGRPRPYFLFVGERARYKNFGLAVQALSMCRLASDHELLCFGGGAFGPDEYAVIERFGLQGRVHQVGGDDAVLAGLYEGAEALLYPSLYEGFGMPLLEAMIHRCPVVATPLTSLPEVGADAALYPEAEPGAWAETLELIVADTARRERLLAAGQRRAGEFSWARTAAAYAEVYRAVV